MSGSRSNFFQFDRRAPRVVVARSDLGIPSSAQLSHAATSELRTFPHGRCGEGGGLKQMERPVQQSRQFQRPRTRMDEFSMIRRKVTQMKQSESATASKGQAQAEMLQQQQHRTAKLQEQVAQVSAETVKLETVVKMKSDSISTMRKRVEILEHNTIQLKTFHAANEKQLKGLEPLVDNLKELSDQADEVIKKIDCTFGEVKKVHAFENRKAQQALQLLRSVETEVEGVCSHLTKDSMDKETVNQRRDYVVRLQIRKTKNEDLISDQQQQAVTQDQTSKKLEDMMSELEMTSASVHQQEVQLSSKRNVIRGIEDRVVEKENTVKGLVDEQERLQKLLDVEGLNIETSQNETSEQQQRASELQQELKLISKGITTDKEQTSQGQKELQQLSQRLDELETHSKTAQGALDSLVQENEEQQQRVENIQRKKSKTSETTTARKTELKQLAEGRKQRIVVATAAMKTSKAEIKEFEKTKAQLEEALQAAKKAAKEEATDEAKTQTKFFQMQERIKSLDGDIERLNTEKAGLEKVVKEADNQAQVADAERANRLLLVRAELEKDIQTLETKIAEQSSQAQQIKEFEEFVQGHHATRQSKMSAKRLEIKELTNLIKSLKERTEKEQLQKKRALSLEVIAPTPPRTPATVKHKEKSVRKDLEQGRDRSTKSATAVQSSLLFDLSRPAPKLMIAESLLSPVLREGSDHSDSWGGLTPEDEFAALGPSVNRRTYTQKRRTDRQKRQRNQPKSHGHKKQPHPASAVEVDIFEDQKNLSPSEWQSVHVKPSQRPGVSLARAEQPTAVRRKSKPKKKSQSQDPFNFVLHEHKVPVAALTPRKKSVPTARKTANKSKKRPSAPPQNMLASQPPLKRKVLRTPTASKKTVTQGPRTPTPTALSFKDDDVWGF